MRAEDTSTKVLLLIYANPGAYPPLIHIARCLAQAGARVKVLGIRAAPGPGDLLFPAINNVSVTLLPHCKRGWRQKLHYLRFSATAFLSALTWRADWVYGSDPLCCPGLVATTLVTKTIYHEHDVPQTADNPREAGSKVSTFIKAVLLGRRLASRIATACVVPNPKREALLRAQTGTKQSCFSVWNCPERKEALAEASVASHDATLTLFYHGSIVPARLPVTIIEALAALPATVRLRIAGYETVGHSGYLKRLQETAMKLGLRERVDFLGAIPNRDELLEHCRQADVGLALMPLHSRDANEQTMAGASNKPFEYLACGLALLVSALPDWESLYVQAGMARACDPADVASITAALGWFKSHPEETRNMGIRGQRAIKDSWNYDAQFKPVLDFMLGPASAENSSDAEHVARNIGRTRSLRAR